MKQQFDIWRFDFPERGEHSVVLISHPDICAKASQVNALYCTSQRQSRAPHSFEVMLNGEEKRGCGRDGFAKLFTDLTGAPIDFTSLPATTGGINGPCAAKRRAAVGFTVIKRDGLWYVSPTRTMFDAMTATMKTLDRANLDCLVKETRKVIDSSGRSLTGSDVAAQAEDPTVSGGSDPAVAADDAVITADSMGNATLLADTTACREFKAKSDASESPFAEVIDQCFSDAFDTEP